jgi:hypothetical protein
MVMVAKKGQTMVTWSAPPVSYFLFSQYYSRSIEVKKCIYALLNIRRMKFFQEQRPIFVVLHYQIEKRKSNTSTLNTSFLLIKKKYIFK